MVSFGALSILLTKNVFTKCLNVYEPFKFDKLKIENIFEVVR